MKRIIDHYLQEWREQPKRKALLLRGARQVGKTFSVRALGETFDEFVEVNLEMRPDVAKVFEYNLEPGRIVRELRLLLGKEISPGKSLLFFDEVQQHPQALTALRYFHEQMPELHTIAAVSLLEFTLEQVGLPVGRVTSLHMYPMSFIEFLAACGQSPILHSLLDAEGTALDGEALHGRLLRLLGEYLAIGGLPEVVGEWVEGQDLLQCQEVLDVIVSGYRQDFLKYAKVHQIKYVDLIFNEIPVLLSRKFKYSALPGSWKARELSPALDLLCKAGVVHKVTQSTGHALPLKAGSKPQHFKPLYLDIGLAQRVMSTDVRPWLVDPDSSIGNISAIIEAFVGQEMLAYDNPKSKVELFYWHREARSSNAEIDYLLALDGKILPLEVKAGCTGSLRSLGRFLEEKPDTPHGVRFWSGGLATEPTLHSYPLYAIAHLFRESIPRDWF